MATLTRQALTESAVPRYAVAPLSNGLEARIRSITEAEKSSFEAIAYDAEGKFNVNLMKLRRRKLIQLCLVDDDGKNLYSPKEVTAMVMDGGLASEIFAACIKHCGLDVDNESISEKKLNSEPIIDSDSPSASALASASMTPSAGSTPSAVKSSIGG